MPASAISHAQPRIQSNDVTTGTINPSKTPKAPRRPKGMASKTNQGSGDVISDTVEPSKAVKARAPKGIPSKNNTTSDDMTEMVEPSTAPKAGGQQSIASEIHAGSDGTVCEAKDPRNASKGCGQKKKTTKNNTESDNISSETSKSSKLSRVRGQQRKASKAYRAKQKQILDEQMQYVAELEEQNNAYKHENKALRSELRWLVENMCALSLSVDDPRVVAAVQRNDPLPWSDQEEIPIYSNGYLEHNAFQMCLERGLTKHLLISSTEYDAIEERSNALNIRRYSPYKDSDSDCSSSESERTVPSVCSVDRSRNITVAGEVRSAAGTEQVHEPVSHGSIRHTATNEQVEHADWNNQFQPVNDISNQSLPGPPFQFRGGQYNALEQTIPAGFMLPQQYSGWKYSEPGYVPQGLAVSATPSHDPFFHAGPSGIFHDGHHHHPVTQAAPLNRIQDWKQFNMHGDMRAAINMYTPPAGHQAPASCMYGPPAVNNTGLVGGELSFADFTEAEMQELYQELMFNNTHMTAGPQIVQPFNAQQVDPYQSVCQTNFPEPNNVNRMWIENSASLPQFYHSQPMVISSPPMALGYPMGVYVQDGSLDLGGIDFPERNGMLMAVYGAWR